MAPAESRLITHTHQVLDEPQQKRSEESDSGHSR